MLNKLYREMIAYEAGCPERAQHLVKVHSFARHIALMEGVDEHTRFVIEAAALVHDIGIKPALEKHGSSAGPLQEKEGAPIARALLLRLGFDPADADRVAYLVGHHHTYDAIDGPDYQILVEADFLVNYYENGMSKERVAESVGRIFRTKTGTEMANTMFSL